MIDLVPLAASHLDDCAALVASLPLYASYGLDVARARAALHAALSDERADVVVAVRDGIVLGHAWFVRRGAFDRSAYLKQIAVRADTHGAGVGALLLAEGERRHLAPGGLALLVTSTNAGARRFYERHGYAFVGTLPRYVHPQHDECLYFKPAKG